VAIVSQELFETVWRQVFDYWTRAGRLSTSVEFKDYLFRGWMRPDKLPFSSSFTLKTEWFEYFASLARSERFGPYKITGALYKSWHFFEAYQMVAVEQCIRQQELEYEDLSN